MISLPSSTRNLIAGTASRYVLLLVNLGLGLVLLPFTVRHLGLAEYGLWMMVASMTYYFQLLDMGYGSGLVRHVADADARRDVALVNQVLSTFVVVYAAIGAIAVAAVAGIIIWVIPRFPNLPAEQIARAQIILALLGLRIAIGFPMTVFGAATTARQRFALNNAVAIVVALLNGAITFVVLNAGYGLLTLVASTTALAILSYAAYAWTARKALPEMRIRPSSFNAALVRDVTTFSVYLFVIDIAVQIGFNLDNIVIGAALGTSTVAIYAVATRLADYQRQMCNQLNGLLFPVIVRFGATRDEDGLRATLVDGTRIALTLIVGVTICVVVFAEPLISRWMGPGFDASIAPLTVLALAGVVLVGQGPLGNVLLGTGHHRLVAFTALGEALANLALSVVLVRRFGILGVAIGTAVPVVLANLFVLLPAACRQLGMSVVAFGRAVAIGPLVGALPAVTAAVALRTLAPPESIGGVFLEGTLTGAVYLAAVCAFGFEPAVRARYLGYARQFVASSALGRIRTPNISSQGISA